MAIQIPDSVEVLKALCSKYQKQLKDLTQAKDRERLKYEMEIYFQEEKLSDYEALCKREGLDFKDIIKQRDEHRRKIHKG